MSAFGLSRARSWQGKRVARQVSEAAARGRLVVTGVIREVEVVPFGATVALRCLLEDGSGELELLFLGRSAVPGVVAGARCSAEGTLQAGAGHKVVWNPRYRLEQAPAAEASLDQKRSRRARTAAARPTGTTGECAVQ